MLSRNRDDAAPTNPDLIADAGPDARLPTSNVMRLAQMVADGQLPMPVEIVADQLDQITRMVRGHRRRRLIRHIARVIAIDIQKSRKLRKGKKDA